VPTHGVRPHFRRSSGKVWFLGSAGGVAPLRQAHAGAGVTVIVPAYNEAASIADTIASLQAQTARPHEIIIVDDCSTDGTGDIARGLSVTVVRPPTNTGSKAGAQSFALRRVRTPFTVAVDADTVLAPDAIERLLPAFDRPGVAAACGFVVPKRVRSVWERGRYIEYLFAFTYYKQLQEFYGKPLISSGCFSMYRTAILRAQGGWSNRTLAEDMDLTWTFYQAGHEVRFVPEAVCYPLEPRSFRLMGAQLRRWSHGFVQNVRLHWRGLLTVPFLRSAVAVAFWDATIAAAVYLVLLPILAVLFASPWILLGYVIDAPAVLVPVLAGAARRGEIRRAIASLPAFFLLRTVNAVFFLRAVCAELLLGRSLHLYEKGH
jgi:cellulose synthase/poly-beta-1,6-N-acetylglucosamine synthase-like glycosyltransferase